MKRANIFCLLMIMSLALYLAGCSSRPTEMINLTEQTRTEAANEHADQFASDDWEQGEKAWQQANSKLDAQSYGEAGNLLLKAKTYYAKARDRAKEKRAVTMNQIARDKKTATIRLQTLKDDPAAQKLSGARKKEFDAEVKRIEESIASVSSLVEKAQYTDANQLIGKATRDIWEAQQEYLKK